jgi:hypothetical protein
MDNHVNEIRINVTNNLKLGSINICGLSNRSRMVINNYIHSEKFDAFSVQETGTSVTENLELHNMHVISDSNDAANRGAALYVSKKHTITKLDHISKMSRNLDSCWGLVVASKKRYIMGNIYIKLNHKPAIAETMKMLKAAEKEKEKLKASGIILMGDFNARHLSWGDKQINYYGRCLAESLDNSRYSICISKSPTFLCSNGSSYIDLSIISNELADSVIECKTDEGVELFSGAPLRGHVPVVTILNVNRSDVSATVTEKLDLSKMKWEEWTKHIDDSIEEDRAHLEAEENPYILWNRLNYIITQATDTHGQTKKCCKHSKPYWTNGLNLLSQNLRTVRKNYIKRNTDNNLKALNDARAAFDEERKRACENFLIDTAKQLNSAQAQRFWKDFNKLFKKKSTQNIDPLVDDNKILQTDSDRIEQCLFSVFFEARHLTDGDFDDHFYQEVNNIYDQIVNEDLPNETEENVRNLNCNITLQELQKAIKANGKSVDNFNFHPSMFRHLGDTALALILRIFIICLKTHTWIWEGAEVIFLRKDGKDNYSKPGSYRPICITSYIGKLFEAIIARRIEIYLKLSNQTDAHQEGFSESKNTIRYLNRLHLGILSDKERHLSILCLFVDFEKAFDSVWKKGLLIKLNQLGITGNVANLINSFLFTRKVKLNINGKVGNERQCAEYGLPQGSALSPVLFKIYLQDFLSELTDRPEISLMKFADDGTLKISTENSQTCVQILNEVLECLQQWTRKWRMKVNCDKNKTEVICFNTNEGDINLIPHSFKFGNKEIYRVSETKVLGLVIDEKLTYKSHCQLVIKSLQARWASICKYSNRYWGFNVRVMMCLIKALFISKMSYAGHIWITKENLSDLNHLWYHILKSVIGAELNISHNIAELILGIPPIHIQTQINSIKHFLKIMNKPVQHDIFKEFLCASYNDEIKSPTTLHYKLRDTLKFLEWKISLYPSHFNETDKNIVNSRQISNIFNLSQRSCSYTQPMMKQYTEKILWARSIRNQFNIDGYPTSPNPSCDLIPIPPGTPRKAEVQLLSLLYKNNLLNQSLYNIGRSPSPLCRFCHQEEETAEHLLFACSHVDQELRSSVHRNYRLALQLSEDAQQPIFYIGLLNAIRNSEFINACLLIVTTLDIDVLVEL